MSLLRLLATAIGVVLLASCRSIDAPRGGGPPLPSRAVGCDSPPAARLARNGDRLPPPADCPADCPRIYPRIYPEHCVVAVEPPVRQAGGCLICDGGDGGSPARPLGREGLANLTAGDTVARYRGIDEAEDSASIAVSNCTCVFSPRFSSVRQVTRPFEESLATTTGGVITEDTTETGTAATPVVAERHRDLPATTRGRRTGLGIEARNLPLGVAEELLPDAAIGGERARGGTAEQLTASAERRRRPHTSVGFDVPYAWTCLRQAMVRVGEVDADVVTADAGTAVLRIEQEGRAELTLSKQAGSPTARAGEELDFTIVFFNSGETPLVDVVIADSLPKRLVYVDDSADASRPASFSTAIGEDGATVLAWRLEETLAPGEEGFVRFRTQVR